MRKIIAFQLQDWNTRLTYNDQNVVRDIFGGHIPHDHPLFNDLLTRCEVGELPASSHFIREGEDGDYVYIVVSGEISIQAHMAEGDIT
jgi:CRP-like cAMP-binding protein